MEDLLTRNLSLENKYVRADKKIGPIIVTDWYLVPDVYSFEEEEAVLDPHISDHLSHFGIDMLQMQKRVSCLGCEQTKQKIKCDSSSVKVWHRALSFSLSL